MPDVAVYHPYFGQGGAESVCMHTLEALQSDWDLTLFTLTDVDLDDQNEYFDTDVAGVPIRRVDPLGPALNRAGRATKRVLGHRFGRLQGAVFARRFRTAVKGKFDLVVSTHGELGVELPSVQYIHYPWYKRGDLPSTVTSIGTGEALYNTACRVVSNHEDDAVRSATLLTNSEWSADMLERLYGVRPATVYPPVKTDEFEPRPWDERENGFVTVSRIAGEKNVLRNVQIVDELRSRGHDVHLHVVGPTVEEEYRERLERRARDRSHLSVEGRISRQDLVEMLCTHRYGLHGMEYEHFGIAIAEMVAAGMIPFVPATGGQREVVDKQSDVLYESVSDAVAKCERVLSSRDRQATIREALPDVSTEFGPERFERKMQTRVAETFARSQTGRGSRTPVE